MSEYVNKEEMKERGIELLKELEKKGLDPEVRTMFEQGRPSISHCQVGLKEMSPDEKETMINNEKEFGHLVFHTIYTETTIGPMLAYLFVSKYKEDWSMDTPLIEENKIYAYVENINDKYCSEYGIIAFDINNHCMRRVF